MGPAGGLIDQPVLPMGAFDHSSPTSFIFVGAVVSEWTGEDVAILLVSDARVRGGNVVDCCGLCAWLQAFESFS